MVVTKVEYQRQWKRSTKINKSFHKKKEIQVPGLYLIEERSSSVLKQIPIKVKTKFESQTRIEISSSHANVTQFG